MTLTVFIIQNGRHSDYYLKKLQMAMPFVEPRNFIYCRDVVAINEHLKTTNFYLVLNEGEIPDDNLAFAVFKIVSSGGFGCAVFNFFKKTEQKYSICSRLFKSFVKLQETGLAPSTPLVTVATNVLDGWVLDI